MGSEEKSTNMDNQSSGYMMTAGPNLLALPDDVLLIIMSFLSPLDLLNVARLSERLEELSQHRTLWAVVDTRPNRLTLTDLAKVVEQLRPTTRMLAARGFVPDLPENVCISVALLMQICSQCPALDTLILEQQYAEIKQSKKQRMHKQMHIELFPKTLTTLSLKGCDFQIRNYQESFFHDIDVYLPVLKVLILSGCSWVYPHDFLPIGKCCMLEELRMDGCHRLGECVAYTSLAARFGFPALKILDLRDTNMGDSDVSCFNRTTTLTHLYLECPSNLKHNRGRCSTRYGWTEYVFPEGSPIIVINRLGQNVDDFHSLGQNLHSERDHRPPATTTTTTTTTAAAAVCSGEIAGPSSGADERRPKHVTFHKLYNGSRSSMWPTTVCMASPGPSSASEKSEKRKSESESSSSKRVKREVDGNSEEGPVNGSSGLNQPFWVRSENNNEKERESDNTSDSSSDEDEGVVYTFRGEHYVRKLTKIQREVTADGIPGPEPIISDLCVMSFAERSSAQNNQNGDAVDVGRGVVSGGNVWYVRLMYPEAIGGRPNLQTLVLRNFSRITNQSLRYLSELSSLRYLDVSGTSVTESAVLDFKLRRPEVEVISDFDVPF